MKRYILIFVGILVLGVLLAQKTLYIFKSDSSVITAVVDNIDSVKFGDGSSVVVHKADSSVVTVPISEIDSMVFSDYALPTVSLVSSSYIYTTYIGSCVAKVSATGGCSLTSRGICWSKTHNPTIKDSVYSSLGKTTGQFIAKTRALDLNETYYVRAFASNCLGTAYSDEVVIKPTLGNVTYTLGVDSASYPTQYRLIKTAMDSACWYYTHYTRFRGNAYVYYSSGIPTAQASYHGSIGFGASTTYMWVGTAMHEMAHFVGSGTTTAWQNLMVSNVWTGSTASALLLSETGETLKGDSQHFWPYGINYKSEITALGNQAAQKAGLILHCQLVDAMIIDDAGISSSW